MCGESRTNGVERGKRRKVALTRRSGLTYRYYQSMREEYPNVSACVDQIAQSLKADWSIELADEEKLYLILHVNRVCSKESSDN